MIGSADYSLVIEHNKEIGRQITANRLSNRLREHRDYRPGFLSGLLSVGRPGSPRLTERKELT